MNDRGFVEQRVMMGAAGLEYLMWQTMVLEGGMSERQYRDQDAHEKLRRLLTHAQIPSDIDAALLPVSARFAAEEQQRQGRHYLVLLILHSLGYQGSYRDLRKTGGWAGDVGDVPWSRTGAG